MAQDLHEELNRGGGMRESIDKLLADHAGEIEELRRRTADVLPKDPEYDEIFLLRFVLTHIKRDGLAVAEDSVRKTVEWRTKNAQVLQKVASTGKAPFEEIALKFNTSGYAGDLGGSEPVWVVRSGLCNLKGLMSTLTVEQVVDWLTYSKEIFHRQCDQRTRKTRTLVKMVTIIDWEGNSLFGGDRRFYKALGDSSKLSALYYPQLLGKTVMLNTPSFFRVIFRAISVFMPRSALEKVAICPAQNIERDRRSLTECPFVKRFGSTPDDFPSFLGGTRPCPEPLLPRSETASSLTRVTVAARSSETLEFEVPAAAQAAWEVVVQDFGIGLEAVFHPEGGGIPSVVMAMNKIKAEGGLASGTLELPGAGVLRVTFDNSYSILRSKTFDYRIDVREGSRPAESAHEVRKLVSDIATMKL